MMPEVPEPVVTTLPATAIIWRATVTMLDSTVPTSAAIAADSRDNTSPARLARPSSLKALSARPPLSRPSSLLNCSPPPLVRFLCDVDHAMRMLTCQCLCTYVQDGVSLAAQESREATHGARRAVPA